MMTKRCGSTLVVALGLSTLLSGCFYAREIAHTRRDIERQYPEARFEREVVVSLGSGTIYALWRLGSLVPEPYTQMISDYLDEIEEVKVGVYHVDGLPPLTSIELGRLRRFEGQGWLTAVKSVEEDEAVWVLYRERYGAVRDVYVLTLSDDELVLVRVQGSLSRLLERIMVDYPYLTRALRDHEALRHEDF